LVHINRIKPCYQRDDTPEEDEDIEDLLIVEVTYPTINQAPTTSATSQQTNITQDLVQITETRAKENTHTTPSTDSPLTTPEQPTDNQNSTSAPQGSILSDNQTESDQFWNALKILRQTTGKGKPRYLIRWEDPTAPDSWSDAKDVSEKLKRVFYLTHTKTGTKRIHPLEDTEDRDNQLTVIDELDELKYN